jgi:diguanylate cyclase (GGDEF)-like protein
MPNDSRLTTPIVLHWLHHAVEPHILFPAITILVLGLIWGSTYNRIQADRITAERTAAVLAQQLASTYEAQVVRALREIDQTLNIVKYSAELRGIHSLLPTLKGMGLLPPELVFTVSITDSAGDIVASTSSSPPSNVADQNFFQSQLQTDTFSISRPQAGPDSGAAQLHFSRRLTDAVDGRFSGIVMLSVDAAYFVSSYDSAVLGEHGLLCILASDGVIIVRRSGDSLSAGDRLDFAAFAAQADDQAGDGMNLSVDAMDGVARYRGVHALYGFPLLVIVGLSLDEQLAPTRVDMQKYLWRSAAASLLLMLVAAVLGYMSRQLALNRRKVAQVQLAQAELSQHMAYHDALTGLPNRSLFSKLLGQGIQLAHRNHRQLALLFLDLDRFKHINDTLGHEAGDQLLQEVAVRLKACLRDSDTVARLGGDEFVVLLPELDEDQYVATVARKILTAVASPFMLCGQQIRVTASVGIGIYPQDGLDEQVLTKNADTAMYHAKEEGKNNFKFFSEKLNTNSLERLTLESGIRHALERNEFQLHYQAKRDISSGLITGMEALLRWQHPDLGTVAPLQFLPLAEETGLMLPIGKWVLRTACKQNMAWQALGLPHVSVAVNLTPRQFEDATLLPELTAILADSGMDAHLLELEISEIMLLHDIENKMQVLQGLKQLGVRIAIDDFGSGYASLATLRNIPLDSIKIDRSFILNITSVTEDKVMIEAMLALGRALNFSVVAQGVETKEQADYLRMHCSGEFQGFYVNRPLPADQIVELLQKQAEDTETRPPLRTVDRHA